MTKRNPFPENGLFYQELEEWKTRVLSPYCVDICEGQCCNLSRFSLGMTKSELVVLLGEEPADLRRFRLLGKYERYHYEEGWCPQYAPEQKKCLVHEREDRPRGCKDFPFTKIISPRRQQLSLDHCCSFAHNPPGLDNLRELLEKHQVELLVLNHPWYL